MGDGGGAIPIEVRIISCVPKRAGIKIHFRQNNLIITFVRTVKPILKCPQNPKTYVLQSGTEAKFKEPVQ